jgi:hypothetical protein
MPLYQSMYDMVKRRSNKEREKEDQKVIESRAKSLSQIAQVCYRPIFYLLMVPCLPNLACKFIYQVLQDVLLVSSANFFMLV